MASYFAFRSVAILLVSVLQSVSAKAVDYPVGVSLGHYHWSSAYYNAKNELINVVTINSSREWQDYFWATWTDHTKHTPDYDPDTIAMFSRALKEIQLSTEIALSLPVEYRSVTAPAHFTMTSSMSSLMRAAYDLRYFASGQSYQVINFHNAARLAYDLDNCKGLRLPAGCIVDDVDIFVLVLEYSKRYLAVSFLNIGHYICIPIDGRKFPKNGEEANRGYLTDHNGETFVGLALAIQEFMDEMIAYLVESNIDNPESKIQGIILAGEASIEGMDEMKQVIGKALPVYKGSFLFSIDPRVIGAVGAAHRARQYVTEHAITGPLERPLHEDL